MTKEGITVLSRARGLGKISSEMKYLKIFVNIEASFCGFVTFCLILIKIYIGRVMSAYISGT